MEVVARVAHREFFVQGWVVGVVPGDHVDDLFAVEVNDVEVGVFGGFEGVAVAARDAVEGAVRGDGGVCRGFWRRGKDHYEDGEVVFELIPNVRLNCLLLFCVV